MPADSAPLDAVVVDASAMAALLFGEPAAEEIAGRIGDRVMYAPTLLRYEVASVCLKKSRRSPDRAGVLRSGLALLERLAIREVRAPARDLVDAATGSGLSAYDAAYLWLAMHLGVALVTLDRPLREAFDLRR